MSASHAEPYHRVVKRLMVRVATLTPRVQDLALAVALTIVDCAVLVPYRSQLHPFGAALALIAAQNIPLTWRRSWPVPVLIAVAIPRITYDVLGFGYAPFPLAPAIAFFTAMERCQPAMRRVVLVVSVIGITIPQLTPGHHQPYDAGVVALTFITAWMAAVLSRTRRAHIQEVEERAIRAESERDDGAARVAAQERTRIARELHDVVAHHVSLMAVQAEAATSLLPDRPAEAARSVEIIASTARQALTELRRLLGVLRGPSEQLETSPSMSLADLGAVLDQVRGAGLPVELTVLGTPGPLAPGIDLTAYRIVQEALTNTVRHARGSHATVALSYEPGYVTVSVTDSRVTTDGSGPATNGPGLVTSGPGLVTNGPGLVTSGPGLVTNGPGLVTSGPGLVTNGPGPAMSGAAGAGRGVPRSGGFGLAGIAERVASCGGNLTVGPTPSGGFAITARLPAR
jgi:signal transduction histidine kinase